MLKNVKNYVFGDTGGHADQLFASLVDIGVDLEAGIIPDDVRIIHLGDLIHKGPLSHVILQKVDKLIDNNPGRWIQILGNHEFQHIDGAFSFWKCQCSPVETKILNKWYFEGKAYSMWALSNHNSDLKIEVSDKPKIAIPAEQGIVFTHAGLTLGWWLNFCDKIADPVELAAVVNELSLETKIRPGAMLGGGRRSFTAGPAWAIASEEVFPSWNGNDFDMPFIQFHGHSSAFDYTFERWRNTLIAGREFRDSTKVNPFLHATITSLKGSVMIGTDPGYNKYPTTSKQPYVFFTSNS